MTGTEELVFGFDRAHAPGTICGFPCPQCGDRKMQLTGTNGNALPDTPFYIVGKATYDDWQASVLANGGDAGKPARTRRVRHFYFVRTD